MYSLPEAGMSLREGGDGGWEEMSWLESVRSEEKGSRKMPER